MRSTARRRGGKARPSERDIEHAAEAARCVVRTHEAVAGFLREGQTLAEIDRFVADTLAKLGCKSCFLHYRAGRHPPFPAHACLSVNDNVVHGHPGAHQEPMQPGDVLKVDIGVTKAGWIGDAAWTYSFGEPDETTRRLMDCSIECLKRGVAALQPGAPLIDWARAVQGYAEQECGFHMIRGLGGHGYGRSLHAPPFVSNCVPAVPRIEWPDAYAKLEPGMLLAVEPMIAVGSSRIVQRGNGWPLMVADGSQSVHHEHDVLITEEGPRVLTADLEKLPDVITT
ncbi:MAG: type I methionyl aminopeptidase [Planctomycetota bacterium]